jgi:hypothetical protein
VWYVRVLVRSENGETVPLKQPVTRKTFVSDYLREREYLAEIESWKEARRRSFGGADLGAISSGGMDVEIGSSVTTDAASSSALNGNNGPAIDTSNGGSNFKGVVPWSLMPHTLVELTDEKGKILLQNHDEEASFGPQLAGKRVHLMIVTSKRAADLRKVLDALDDALADEESVSPPQSWKQSTRKWIWGDDQHKFLRDGIDLSVEDWREFLWELDGLREGLGSRRGGEQICFRRNDVMRECVCLECDNSDLWSRSYPGWLFQRIKTTKASSYCCRPRVFHNLVLQTVSSSGLAHLGDQQPPTSTSWEAPVSDSSFKSATSPIPSDWLSNRYLDDILLLENLQRFTCSAALQIALFLDPLVPHCVAGSHTLQLHHCSLRRTDVKALISGLKHTRSPNNRMPQSSLGNGNTGKTEQSKNKYSLQHVLLSWVDSPGPHRDLPETPNERAQVLLLEELVKLAPDLNLLSLSADLGNFCEGLDMGADFVRAFSELALANSDSLVSLRLSGATDVVDGLAVYRHIFIPEFLGQMRSLTRLFLPDCEFGGDYAPDKKTQLGPALKALPSDLVALDLRWTSFSATNSLWSVLGDAISRVEHLRFTDFVIPGEEAEERSFGVFDSVRNVAKESKSTLKELTLPFVALSHRMCLAIAEIVEFGQLVSLDLFGCHSLPAGPGVERLNATDLQPILRALSRTKTLEVFRVAGDVGHGLSENCGLLVQAVKRKCCVLKNLWLQETMLGRTGLTWLFEALSTNTTLEELSLVKVYNAAENANPNLRDRATNLSLGAAASAVLKNPASKLRSLRLASDVLRLSDAGAIFTALCDDRATLSSLSLRWDPMLMNEDRDQVRYIPYLWAALKLMLQINTSLKSLSLDNNGLHDQCLVGFASGLASNSTLLQFNLRNNEITHDGVEKFWLAVGVTDCCCNVDFGLRTDWRTDTNEADGNGGNENGNGQEIANEGNRNANADETNVEGHTNADGHVDGTVVERNSREGRDSGSGSSGNTNSGGSTIPKVSVSWKEIDEIARQNSRNRRKTELLEDIRRKLCCTRDTR